MKTPEHDDSIQLTLCPSSETIYRYVAGELSDADAVMFEEHVLDCIDCEAALDLLEDPSDTVIQVLSQLPMSSSDELGFQQLFEQVFGVPAEDADKPNSLRQLADPGLGPLPCQLDNYELIECIGRGATGAVFRARHLRLDQMVAVKVFDASRSSTVDAFLQEMKHLGRLTHPNVVRATDASVADGLHYLVMEYIDGIDASRLLRRKGSLKTADACEIARQAALGLQFVHDQSLVHRDIKPSNLLVTVDGQVKLLDMGIATCRNKARASEATPSTLVGTLDYMAPEQREVPEQADSRSDLYSLGGTLFRLLTSQKPPRRREGELKIPTEVPRAVQRLLRRLLSPNPKDRPDSIEEVIAALLPVARGADLVDLVRSLYPACDTIDSSSVKTAPRRKRISRRWASAAVLTIGATLLLPNRLRPQADKTPPLSKAGWRPLEPIQPVILLDQALPPSARCHVDSLGTISVSSTDLVLINLGRPIAGRFRFGLHIESNRHQYRGCFFQAQANLEEAAPSYRFQTIELQPRSESSPSLQSHRLTWNLWSVQRNDDQIITNRTPLAQIYVDLSDHSEKQHLQVVCGRKGMPEITWNGKLLHESKWHISLDARNMQRLPAGRLPTAFLGRLGVLSSGGDTTFFQPQLAYL